MKLLGYLCLLLLCAGCARTGLVRPEMETRHDGPPRVVILPPMINAYEVAFGGTVQRIPEWEQQAGANLEASIVAYGERGRLMRPVRLAGLSADEDKSLHQYNELLRVIGRQLFELIYHGQGVWTDVRSKFDYSVGPGIGFLARKSGADMALFSLMDNKVPTGSRKFVEFMTSVTSFLPLARKVEPFNSDAIIGLVDLHTGRVMWINTAVFQSRALYEKDEMDRTLKQLFKTYPEH